MKTLVLDAWMTIIENLDGKCEQPHWRSPSAAIKFLALPNSLRHQHEVKGYCNTLLKARDMGRWTSLHYIFDVLLLAAAA